MIDILFIAQNRHQFEYFTKLSKNLEFNCKVVMPKHFCYSFKKCNIDKKLDEVERKYSSFKAILYKPYIKLITPYFECNYRYYINKFNPKIVALWNGVKYPQNIAVNIAKEFNKKIIYFENGFLPNTTQADCKGVNAGSSIPRDYEFYKNLTIDTKLPKDLNKREFVGKQKLYDVVLPKSYIFVPFQVAYDSQIINFSNFSGMEELFYLIAKIANNLKINFVFKEHPSDRVSDYSKLHNIANESPYLTFANSVDTQELIQNAKAVVTINSSVGIESLLFSKKVYVLGEAFYAIDGITIKANKNTLVQKLQDKQEIDFKVVENFLKYLQSYLLPNSWKEPKKEHYLALNKRIKQCLQ